MTPALEPSLPRETERRRAWALGLCLAWLLSSLPVIAPFFGLEIAGASRAGLALLPWVALAGLPRRACGPWAFTVGLPPLGLALGLDLAAGAPAAAMARGVLTGLVLIAGWAAAAELGRTSERRRVHYGWVWLVLVPLPAAFGVAFHWAGAGPGGRAAVPGWCQLDPLVWCHAFASARDAPLAGLAAPLVGLALALGWLGGLARVEGGERT